MMIRAADLLVEARRIHGFAGSFTVTGSGNDGFITLVVDRDGGILMGATCVGPRGGDMWSMLELAVREAIPVDRVGHLIDAHPTFYRGIGEAARMLPTGVAQKAAVS